MPLPDTRKLYAALSVAGFLLPMSQVALFIRDHGLDLRAFLTLPFANFAASTFAFDLLVSCAVFWLFLFRSRVAHKWAYVAMTLLVGLSFALPMFLFARESEQFAATLPHTGDDLRSAATAARAPRPVG